jgi:CheY-like chemotaxis protein/two-component sensor histidine kinase
MAQISRQIPQVPEKARTANEKIISASNHLLGVLNDVLDMSKIEAGKFTLADEPFSMKAAMHAVENIIAQRCYEKRIDFDTNVDELPDIFVRGDSLRLKQVLINLLGNAVKFTDCGGQVALEVTATEETGDDLCFRFEVRDNGIGMSEEQLSRLFMAFEQTDNTIASRFGGTGLGLAISQNLVSMMGGEILAASEAGSGSVFTFSLRLPKGKSLPKEEPQEDLPATVSLSGKRILLCEDIEINRLIVIELLEETGLEIDEAADGEEAVQRFKDSPEGYYSLIFMDIQMPRMGGYEAAGIIREMPRPDARTVPIVAMTANAYKEDIDRAFASGMNGHLSKPIDIDAVKRILQELLGAGSK